MTIKVAIFRQENNSYCGPAVVQALLRLAGIKATQDEIVAAARAKSRVMHKGIRPDQLARAVERLAPQQQIWLKQGATRRDLDTLINGHRLPVLINWQGLFYDSAEEERRLAKPGTDFGHYSLAMGINLNEDRIEIQDPYPDYADTPRSFPFKWFQKRWWDVIFEQDQETGKKIPLYTKQLAIVMTDKEDIFMEQLGFTQPAEFTFLTKK